MLYKTLTGIGHLWSGDKKVADKVPYRVSISRDMRAGVPGNWQIEGEIDADPLLMLNLMIGDEPELELELSDGQRWGCFLQNIEGRLLNSGHRNLSVPE